MTPRAALPVDSCGQLFHDELMNYRTNLFALSVVVAGVALVAAPARSGTVSFSDPKGDDNGPGSYTYPTDPVYKKGSFDLTDVTIKESGDSLELTIGVNAAIDDPWDSAKWPTPGNGFSLQMFQIYIDTAPGGETNALPGMNATFADGWEKVIMVSPQANNQIASRIEQKAKALKEKIVLPSKVSAKGKKVTAIVKKSDVDSLANAGLQVLVSSNEGYDNQPNNGILARIVNEYEGKDRFGGGDDGDSDPNFVDCLAGKGKGTDDEKAAQADMLKFDAKAKKRPMLKMVRGS
jgi:carbohydrate-binding DOMON domain-containing protein